MEYKCVEAVFPEMNGAALFQLSVTPMGACDPWRYCVKFAVTLSILKKNCHHADFGSEQFSRKVGLV